jgi:hypothetical protein
MSLRRRLVDDVKRIQEQITHVRERGSGLADVVDVSRPTRGGRTFLQGLASLAGAAGIALAFPFVILLIGLPIALIVRGLLEVVGWVFGVARPMKLGLLSPCQ